MKFTEQEIIEAVKRVVKQKHSIQAAAKSIGMAKTTLQFYVAKAREHGYNSLLRSPKNKSYDGTFKIDAVKFMRKNKLSCNTAAAHFCVTRSILQRWERIYLEEGSQALFQERRGRRTMNQKKRGRPLKLEKQVEEDLIAENQRLKMENEFLKKLKALVLEREKHKEQK